MKPAAFDYVAPTQPRSRGRRRSPRRTATARSMAGGQSLMPLLNFRMTRPSIVVDLMHIPGLSFIELRGDTVAIGALTRHADLEFSDLVAAKLPVMAAAMPHVAHLAIRNRGTIGGSLSHADPAAELPMLAVFYGATIKVQGPGGRREIPAEEFFVSALAQLPRTGRDRVRDRFSGPDFAHRLGIRGSRAPLRRLRAGVHRGVARAVATAGLPTRRVAVMGVADTPLRLREAEAGAARRQGGPETAAKFAEVVRACLSPADDIHVSAEYRNSLIGALAEKAFMTAWTRAAGETP